jgi:hypothetical protein
MAGFAETFRDLDVYQNGLAVNGAYLRPIWDTAVSAHRDGSPHLLVSAVGRARQPALNRVRRALVHGARRAVA